MNLLRGLALLLVFEVSYVLTVSGVSAELLPSTSKQAGFVSHALLAQSAGDAIPPADSGSAASDQAQSPVDAQSGTSEPTDAPPVEPSPTESAPESLNQAPGENAGSEFQNATQGLDTDLLRIDDNSPVVENKNADTEGAVPGAIENQGAVQENTPTQEAGPVQENTPEPVSTASGEPPAANSQTELAASDQSFLSNAVDAEIVQKSDIEENQIAQATTLEQREDLLIQFANEKVDDIGNSLQSQDFATTNFVVQRLNDQIDSFVANLANVSEADRADFESKFKQFSAVAEEQLRAQQLAVPEGLEQDIEISRGKILSTESSF